MSLFKEATPSLESKSLGQLISKYTELKVFDDGVEATLEIRLKSAERIGDIVAWDNECRTRNLLVGSGVAIAVIVPLLLHQVMILDANKSVVVLFGCLGIGGLVGLMGLLVDLWVSHAITASTATLFSRKLTLELTSRLVELSNTKGNYMLDKYSVDNLALISYDSSGKRKVLYSQHRE